jgi:hypothetical protein
MADGDMADGDMADVFTVSGQGPPGVLKAARAGGGGRRWHDVGSALYRPCLKRVLETEAA